MYDLTDRFLDPAFRRLVHEVGRFLDSPAPRAAESDHEPDTLEEVVELLGVAARLHQWQDECPRCYEAGKTVFTVPYRAVPHGVAVYRCEECGHGWRCSWGGDVDPWPQDGGGGPDDEGPGPDGPAVPATLRTVRR
ncbi:hypothetical protein [Rhodococcus pyridinivorans]|uniref:hypothetical protein n=1 Tax=Rhodococcus pyridinivorans TaxID=103816 RepID=UPI002283BA19|nr:hypothetical protein [Rhodococcus pyridinivorans]WAL48266.1 hypothetical protein OQN32_09460 [Rhodococcus pyridinivorans]